MLACVLLGLPVINLDKGTTAEAAASRKTVPSRAATIPHRGPALWLAMDADPSGQAGPAPLPTAEDLLWAFTFGAVLAPLYEALMGGRLIGRPSDK